MTRRHPIGYHNYAGMFPLTELLEPFHYFVAYHNFGQRSIMDICDHDANNIIIQQICRVPAV